MTIHSLVEKPDNFDYTFVPRPDGLFGNMMVWSNESQPLMEVGDDLILPNQISPLKWDTTRYRILAVNRAFLTPYTFSLLVSFVPRTMEEKKAMQQETWTLPEDQPKPFFTRVKSHKLMLERSEDG